jgi:predicted XRE-type DNA-binding protein
MGLDNPKSKVIYHIMRTACAKSLLEISEAREEDDMTEVYKSFISEEEAAKNQLIGQIKGEIKTLYTRVKLSAAQIAEELELTENEVIEILKELKLV